MFRGLSSLVKLALALLDFGPGLELRPHNAAHRQHIRLLLPARAYSYHREDLHDDANARFN
jgi:hypothetical protein